MTGSLNITLLQTDVLTQLYILIGLKCDYDNDDDDKPRGTLRSVCLTSGSVCLTSVSSLRLLWTYVYIKQNDFRFGHIENGYLRVNPYIATVIL